MSRAVRLYIDYQHLKLTVHFICGIALCCMIVKSPGGGGLCFEHGSSIVLFDRVPIGGLRECLAGECRNATSIYLFLSIKKIRTRMSNKMETIINTNNRE